MCEGEKTEPNYFHTIRRAFKLSSVNVEIRDSQGDTAPIKIVHYAADCKKADSDIDEVWCVFDTENPGRTSEIDRAVSAAKAKGIKLAVSNPAFEFWFLLHFRSTSRPFLNAQEVIAELKEHLHDYCKDYPGCGCFVSRTDKAIERAQRILDNHVDSHFAPPPSTYVHLLAKRLKEMRIG